MKRRFGLVAATVLLPALGVPSILRAQSGEVVQPLPPAAAVGRLNSNLARLSRSPQDVQALIGAGQAALDLGDVQAANGFFTRANMVNPNLGAAKLGLAVVQLALKQPQDAAANFDAAEALGEPASDRLADRGLAYDLTGQQAKAQRDYQAALRNNPADAKALVRYAVSLGISGQLIEADKLLEPTLRGGDREAWRFRAFIYAMNGRQAEARNITVSVMPKGLADALDPYMARVPLLTAAQKAAAAHYGDFPANVLRLNPPAPSAAVAAAPPQAQLAAPARAETNNRNNSRNRRTTSSSRSNAQTAQPPAPSPSQQAAAPATPPPAPALVLTPPPPPPEPVQVARADPAPSQPATQPLFQPRPAAPRQTQPAPVTRPTPAPTPTPGPALPVRTAATQVQTPAPAPSSTQVSGRSLAAALSELSVPAAEERQTVAAVDLAAVARMQADKAKKDAEARAKAEKEAKAKAEAAAKKKLKDNPPRIFVQVAAGKNLSALAFDLRRFRRTYGDAIGEESGWTYPWGATNRLLVGPYRRADAAKEVAEKIKKSGGDAFVWQSEAGEEVQKIGGG